MGKRKARRRLTKRVLVVLGSPRRKGNSATLARQAAAGAKSAGAEVETFYLHGMRIAPCSACSGCLKRTRDNCVIDDDMQSLYPKLRSCHALVIASPIYKFSVSAQTKLFFDRCYALSGPEGNALKGTGIGIVLTYGDPDPLTSGVMNAVRMFQDALAYMGAEIVGMVHGSAGEPGEIRHNKAAMKKARDLGRALARRPR